MEQNKQDFKIKQSIIISVAVTLFLLLIFGLIIGMYINTIQQQEILKTTDRFMNFKSQVEQLIYSNKTLVQGYEAYILSNPDLDEASATIYLDNLLSKNQNDIRNIGVVQDTTLIWNYPREGNALAIGIDLATIESQKNLVFKVKNELKPVLQGPVNLIQEGSGLIIRVPVVRADTGYWGQLSIVLKADKIIEEITADAENAGLKIAIFNAENETEPFCGSLSTVGEPSLTFDIDPDFINWKMVAAPKDGWENNWLILESAVLLSLLLAAGAGVITFKALKANYQLRIMSIHDSLTGLYNRHYLNECHVNALTTARRNSRHIGLMSMDLNHFKRINDTYGHNVGDLVLVETARILKKSTRLNEAVFRLGGDEFLVLMPDIKDRTELEQARDRLSNCFDNEFALESYPFKIVLSIGTALFPEDGEDIDALLQTADEQMYADKKEKKRE